MPSTSPAQQQTLLLEELRALELLIKSPGWKYIDSALERARKLAYDELLKAPDGFVAARGIGAVGAYGTARTLASQRLHIIRSQLAALEAHLRRQPGR